MQKEKMKRVYKNLVMAMKNFGEATEAECMKRECDKCEYRYNGWCIETELHRIRNKIREIIEEKDPK